MHGTDRLEGFCESQKIGEGGYIDARGGRKVVLLASSKLISAFPSIATNQGRCVPIWRVVVVTTI